MVRGLADSCRQRNGKQLLRTAHREHAEAKDGLTFDCQRERRLGLDSLIMPPILPTSSLCAQLLSTLIRRSQARCSIYPQWQAV